jgi:YD repeat-containing protein
MTMAPRKRTFADYVQFRGPLDKDRGGNTNMILQFGPRYRQPLDDTTIMSVFHRTTDGSVSVLLERDQFVNLGNALLAESGSHEIHDLQTTAFLDWGPGGLIVRIKWNGSGRLVSVTLNSDQRATLAAILTKMAVNGWEGWKSGVKS